MANLFDEENEFVSKRFKGLDLMEDSIESKIFEECEFKDCNFSDRDVKKCRFIDCSFINCNLSNARIGGSRFMNVEFIECKVIGIDWTQAEWPRFAAVPQLKFYKSILNDSSFFGLKLEEMIIEECKAHEVDFREGDFSRANFKYSDLCRSLFGKTILAEADLTEAVNYDIGIFDNNIQKTKFSRHEAMRLLNGLDIELVD